ncbi:interferon stimulated exonuclease gene 20kDa-like 2 [Schistosoma japonicum]|nr:interferon stimulated exonuclease gene 20kDa-like 2 [Schistosoma japonicum]
MDWDSYYDRLEGWVRKQYDGITSAQRRLENSLLEQQKYVSANALALKKYKQEMGLFQSLYSRNANTSSTSSQSDGRQSAQSRRYLIPHPCRRIVAECIDIAIMMTLKLVILYFVKNDLSLIQLAKGMGSDILSGVPEYRTLRRAHGWAKSEFNGREFKVSSIWRLLFFTHMGTKEDFLDFETIILADQIGRFLSALLEAILIRRSLFGSDPGGATFGKWLMNLKVVSCEEIIPFPDVVEVVPGADLGIIR